MKTTDLVRPLLEAILADRHDAAARAALTDLLIEEGPAKRATNKLPNWLRRAVLWARRAGVGPLRIVTTWRHSSEADALLLLQIAWNDHVEEQPLDSGLPGFDHCGTATALGMPCFISEPYSDLKGVAAHAVWLEDLLWPCCVGVGLEDGAHFAGWTPRMLLLPLAPAPKAKGGKP